MHFPFFVIGAVAISAGTLGLTARLSNRGTPAIVAAFVGAMALVLFNGLGYFRFPLPLDDAFISLRYSRHLADGLGPNWNSSGRVEGYTSFLWMGILAGVGKLGFDLVSASRFLDGVAIAGTFLLVYRIWKLWADENVASGLDSPVVFAAVVTGLALSCGVSYWGFSGLETPVFMALLTASAYLYLEEQRGRRFPWSAVAFAATAMTRPEGLIAAGVTGAFIAAGAIRQIRDRRALTTAVSWGVLFLLLYGSYFLWRYNYYGYLLPNTFYAKAEASTDVYNRGIAYLVTAAPQYHLLAMFGGALVLLTNTRLHRDVAYVTTLCGAMLAGVVLEGGDAFGNARFIVPVLPLMYLTGIAGFAVLLKRAALSPTQAALIGTVALTLAGLALLPSYYNPHLDQNRRAHEQRRTLGTWLSKAAPPDATIGAFAVGAVSYYSNRDALDLLGINDVTIAHTTIPGFGNGIAGHEKYNVDYVLDSARPEIIVIGDAEAGPTTMETIQRLSAVPGGLEARDALLRDPRLAAQYQVRWLLTEGIWFNLLVRNDLSSAFSGPGVIGNDSVLGDPNDTAGWTPWRSTLQPAAEGSQVHSIQVAYGPYKGTPPQAQVRPGQTYVAIVWVRSDRALTTSDYVSLSLRENGKHSPQTESNGFFYLSADWQPIWVMRKITGADAKSLSVHLIKFSGAPKEDSFFFRDPQLVLVSDSAP